MNPQQERRRRVTLIAGMVCKDGIVMAADSEQSGYFRKSNVPKLESYDAPGSYASSLAGSVAGSSVIIAGAGNGELADYASHKIVREAADIMSMDDVEARLEGVLGNIFGTRFPIYKADDLGEFRLLIAIRAPDRDRPKLFSTYGSTLVERSKFVLGSGTLVDYILDQIYDSDMTTEDGVAAALSLLQIAKKYVDGVGGESKVAVLTNEGKVHQKPAFEVREEENILEEHSKLANTLMLSMMRTRTDSDEVWSQHLEVFKAKIGELRIKKKKSDEKIEELWRIYRQAIEEERKRTEAERSRELPYLLPTPARNLFKKEGNVFSGPGMANAKSLGKLPFKQA
jgi:20S proteasome alpha/beta subunit